MLLIRSRSGSKTRLGGGRTSCIRLAHTYEDITSVENLLAAWKEFVRGKRKKRDVQEFQYRLMDNILALHRDLAAGAYRHGGYEAFKISDPKPRDIHKASVQDRLLHHALYRKLYPFFDRTFIADSYSCRKAKGTHRAINRFRSFAYKASKNHTCTCWVLKCDVRKFFASIDQRILMSIVHWYIEDADVVRLVEQVVRSFNSGRDGKGLPLGNLTSQLFVNIYMNEFDQFVKHKLKAKHYVRYADDFVVLSQKKEWLVHICRHIDIFLRELLKLDLHPGKTSIKTFSSGIDFLGWVHFSDHRVLRTSTKRRMSVRMRDCNNENVIASYLGLLKHGNTNTLTQPLRAKLKNLK